MLSWISIVTGPLSTNFHVLRAPTVSVAFTDMKMRLSCAPLTVPGGATTTYTVVAWTLATLSDGRPSASSATRAANRMRPATYPPTVKSKARFTAATTSSTRVTPVWRLTVRVLVTASYAIVSVPA